MIVQDNDLPNAKFEINELTDVVFQRKFIRCQIQSIKDQSKYHVVFNDGDEKELRRTQLVLKGGKHFAADGNLDSMPLTNPESFSTPVIRGAAKRGAQKIRNAISEASGSRGGAVLLHNDDDENDEEDQEDGENEEDADDDDDDTEEQQQPRERRRAAAISAIGVLKKAIEDTQSEESSADSSEERERARSRRKRKDEASSAVTSDEEDQEDLATTDSENPVINGASSAAALSKTLQRKLEKQAMKREKQRLKEEEREEKLRLKEENREKKRREKARIMELKRLEKVYRTSNARIQENHEKSMTQIISHRSVRYFARFSDLKHRRKKKKLYLHEHRQKVNSRIRNVKLYFAWRFVAHKARLSYFARYALQWWRTSEDQAYSLIRTEKLLRSQRRRDWVGSWLEGLEREKIRFVVIHESYTQARRILKYIERGTEKRTFAERCDIEYEDIESSTVSSHFRDQEWFPAVLFPQVFSDENGSEGRQRIVRHMGNGQLVQVWEDDLVPFDWLPEYSFADVTAMTEKKPVEMRRKFKLAWRFATDYAQNRLDARSIRSILEWKFIRPSSRRLKITPIPVQAPSPNRCGEDHDDLVSTPNESDYDSDATIKNVDAETKDLFVAMLVQFHDAHNSVIDTNPTIQGHEVDLYYLYELAKKTGGPKKVYAANLWSDYAKKLVPAATDAEEELKTIFKNFLESYLAINTKLSWPMESLQPRTERKVVLPGQYSESRKKRTQAIMSQVQTPPTAPGSSKKGRVGSGGTRGRKRKVSSESVQLKKRNRKSSSRATTASPGPSEDRFSFQRPQDSDDVTDVPDDMTDHEDLLPEAATRKKYERKSQTPGRRSLSSRRDDTTPVSSMAAAPPKKGRPRKNTTVTTPVLSVPKSEGRGPRKEDTTTKFVRANVLSHILSGQKLRAFYGDEWFRANAIEDATDCTDEIMDIMLAHQDFFTPDTPRLSPSAIQDLDKVLKKIRAKTHYTGWNQRYDEFMKLEKLMVTVEDQMIARGRFRHLPRGRELKAETLALVEKHFRADDEDDGVPKTLAFYLKIAQEALSLSEKRAVADDDESSDSDTDFEQKPDTSAAAAVNGGKSESEEEEEEKTVVMGGDEEAEEEVKSEDVLVESVDQESPPTTSQGTTTPETAATGGLESESDEPEYPPVPEELVPPPPVLLENFPSTDRFSSGGSSNYPTLSRQGSINSMASPMFSPNSDLSLSGPLTLPRSGPLTMANIRQSPTPDEVVGSLRKRLSQTSESSESSELPPPPSAASKSKRIRRASERSIDSASEHHRMMRSPRILTTQHSSGALIFDISTTQPTDTSGPIEALSVRKPGRRKTVFAASPTLLTSGPLTLSSSAPPPPPASPAPPQHAQKTLGRPRKTPSTSSRKPEEEDEAEQIPTTVVGVTEEASVADSSAKEDLTSEDGSATPQDEKDDSESTTTTDTITPKSIRGGKRRRGGGRFGGSYPVKPAKPGRKPKDPHAEEGADEKDPEDQTPTTMTTSTPTRADSFQTQKNRMAKLMEGKPHDYSFLDLPDFDKIIEEAPKEDINILMEERTYELREIFAQCKADLSALEKRYRQQNEAKRKAEFAAKTASSAAAAQASSSTCSTPRP
ncbi:AT-rich interactive domain-containing protein arid-1 [Caenorhabditis elegans]|nr:AT-rich interactive domain-containing protein arid-1 [Caenorhabditis elegans]CTQ86704.1 AT-rich interactive domain-containing protein arid-1 [Caenorhabditis elegans]|eukprot:NP_001300005.1 ARID (AT-rich Interactive Domain-containing protein) homolog [Caenorhabditis elegans]